jgi:hypothetical protein
MTRPKMRNFPSSRKRWYGGREKRLKNYWSCFWSFKIWRRMMQNGKLPQGTRNQAIGYVMETSSR